MTASPSVIAEIAGERRHRTLIKRFLAHLERTRQQHWTALDFPEARIVSREAVQVIAMEEVGRTTAIELVEYSASDTSDPTTRQFVTAFRPLERDLSKAVPSCHVDITVSVGFLPPRWDWKRFADALRVWCTRHLAATAEGHSMHVITIAGTPLRFRLEKVGCAGDVGQLSIVPAEPSGAFALAVQRALERQLPKLLSASADRHVLLFERNEIPWSAGQLRLEIEASLDFPEWGRVHEIWMIDTRMWQTDRSLAFRLVRQSDADLRISVTR